MIVYKLNKFLDENDMSQYWLYKETGIRPGTIGAYYHGFIKRIIPNHLDKMCKALNCQISDLIEYIPDKKTSSPK